MRKILLAAFIVSSAIFSSLVVLRSIAHGADAVYSIDQDNSGFGGAVDFVSEDKVNQKYSTIEGIIDVNTDRYNEITKKYGSIKYNSTATDGSLKHRRAYTYNQADGDSYIIIQTGAYLKATKGDGTFSTVISTLTATADCDFTTANDKLYFVNGTDVSGSWNGSTLTNYTVTNSTYYPTRCKYITTFRNRNWQAGDSLYPNRIYYTEAFAPGLNEAAYEQYLTANFIDCGTQDGDIITGLQVVNGKLYVYFRYKIFEIIELGTGLFGYSMLSDKVGCLYNTSLDILNNLPIFLSHRGVEQFDGANFKTMSTPIDNYVKNLRQMSVSQSLITQSSAEDWGAGTSTLNIDTNTTAGSVVFSTNPIVSEYQLSYDEYYEIGPGGAGNGNQTYAQTFYSTSTVTINNIEVMLGRASSTSGSIRVALANKDYSIIQSSTIAASILPLAYNPGSVRSFNIPDTTLTAGTTYVVLVGTGSSNFSGTVYAHFTGLNTYSRGYALVTGESFADFQEIGGTTIRDMYCNLYYIPLTGSFTSMISTATNWGSWGSITIGDSQPSGSSISYYVKTSTANDNFSTRPGLPVSNGSIINTTVGSYIQVISSFTRTTATTAPQLNIFSISYYGADNNYPQGKVYDDRYYLAVNTGPATMTNDVVLVMQKNSEWTRYSNKVGCFAVHRDNLYYGDSQDTGFMYRMEIKNLYTDNENAYTSKWTSKKIALHPFYKNNIKELWVTSKGDFEYSYNFDDSVNTWTSGSATVSTSFNTNVSKINILPFCYTRYFQFSVGNSSANVFRIKRLDLLYDDAPSAE